ncbi:bifunctional glutamate N-acetyltransferase/amino-acid acetyltransferase ArgJ [Meridianimarinicoccus aquatilis]|uniref:Arginine biosynthesis bifunctional protein ArgJ n=2 Tax=Meridianimarinicoccus aquatilis TaxID=2552766 RepID=A0A4R6AP66_9RHOB|nr:bifunctional glutamate N-acetyltransferase/amino-acid acetyltransferase ArgJ [Fluviibacterium aquatile]
MRRQMSRARRLHKAAQQSKVAKPVGPKVSPLAPVGGFPMLPIVKGVSISAGAAGVRYRNRNDVMLAVMVPGTVMAGVTTRSSTRSAPVLDCEAKLALDVGGEVGAAIVVNSGNSNAFTGAGGFASVKAVAQAVADATGVPEARVFSSSTGVIGEALPHDRIVAVLESLNAGLKPGAFDAGARAIMTTDTYPKGSGREISLGDATVKIAGIAKGSGMIAPDMGTMLVYIFTDARIDQPQLQTMLRSLTDTSFNAITVDSDTSTSDTLLVAATGMAGPQIMPGSADADVFREALSDVMTDLAQQVVRDGEGATKFLEVRVSGAASETDARKVAMSVANSPLVKTAVAGEDPNWGRVVMAVGKSGAAADRDKLSIWFGPHIVAENGWVSPEYREDLGAAYMRQPELVLRVDLGLGNGTTTVWTCDLTHDYISINADYRS